MRPHKVHPSRASPGVGNHTSNLGDAEAAAADDSDAAAPPSLNNGSISNVAAEIVGGKQQSNNSTLPTQYPSTSRGLYPQNNNNNHNAIASAYPPPLPSFDSSTRYSSSSAPRQQFIPTRKGSEGNQAHPFFSLFPSKPPPSSQPFHNGSNHTSGNGSNIPGQSIVVPSINLLGGAAAPAALKPAKAEISNMATPLQKAESMTEWPNLFSLLHTVNGGTPPLPTGEPQMYNAVWAAGGDGSNIQLQRQQHQHQHQQPPYPNFHSRHPSETASIPPSPASSGSVMDSPPTFMTPYSTLGNIPYPTHRQTSPLRQPNASAMAVDPITTTGYHNHHKAYNGSMQRMGSVSSSHSASSQNQQGGGAGPVRTSSEVPSASPYHMSPKMGVKGGIGASGAPKEKKL
ncbi:hypothetical protein HDU67_002306, partial [Dinochytrium kinnereticum]